MTEPQRYNKSLCNAMTKRGVPCRSLAGLGTEHSGIGRCKFHGGATPNHNSNAIVVEATRRMIKFGEPINDAQPHEILIGLLRGSGGHVALLAQRVIDYFLGVKLGALIGAIVWTAIGVAIWLIWDAPLNLFLLLGPIYIAAVLIERGDNY